VNRVRLNGTHLTTSISVNLPMAFRDKYVLGILLAGTLLLSHRCLENVDWIDIWMFSIGAVIYLLVIRPYRQLNYRLATTCKQRNELIESLSHEIRTPLHGKWMMWYGMRNRTGTEEWVLITICFSGRGVGCTGNAKYV
jgi:signal transduction histidine kinase